MAARMAKLEVYAGKGPRKGRFYWRLRAKNGEVVCDGAEGFATRGNARRAARRVKTIAAAAVVTDGV